MKVVHVAVAVIVKPGRTFFDREILISKRPDHVHQGGLWEFPGGKVEDGEHVTTALARELYEELAIQIDLEADSLTPLIEIHHDYGDKQVFLDVWIVSEFEGVPRGNEGQPVKWVSLSELGQYDFPAANAPILNACRLPRRYAISPQYASLSDALAHIERIGEQGVSLFLFRQPELSQEAYLDWSAELLKRCKQKGIKLLASGSISLLETLEFDGIQLPWREALKLSSRPVSSDKLMGVSCHRAEELSHAESIGADFACLSPVHQTQSHPEATPMGWDTFTTMVHQAKLPVFALGGIECSDAPKAIASGAQGIAGIRCWLP